MLRGCTAVACENNIIQSVLQRHSEFAFGNNVVSPRDTVCVLKGKRLDGRDVSDADCGGPCRTDVDANAHRCVQYMYTVDSVLSGHAVFTQFFG